MSLALIAAVGRGSAQYEYEPTDWSRTLCIVPGVGKERERKREGRERREGRRRGREARKEGREKIKGERRDGRDIRSSYYGL